LKGENKDEEEKGQERPNTIRNRVRKKDRGFEDMNGASDAIRRAGGGREVRVTSVDGKTKVRLPCHFC
jgi:hypothetical protein